jgi:hypothetical protein
MKIKKRYDEDIEYDFDEKGSFFICNFCEYKDYFTVKKS